MKKYLTNCAVVSHQYDQIQRTKLELQKNHWSEPIKAD